MGVVPLGALNRFFVDETGRLNQAIAALAGREDGMSLVGRAGENRVAVQGGTYCEHPASLLAAKVFMTYLVEHDSEVYGRLAELGRKMRHAMTSGFREEGILATCTGAGPDLPAGSSLAMVNFPYDEATVLDRPEAVHDPAVCDVELRTEVLGAAMLLEGVHLVQGHGSAATAHTDEDMERLRDACRTVARRVRPYVKAAPRHRRPARVAGAVG